MHEELAYGFGHDSYGFITGLIIVGIFSTGIVQFGFGEWRSAMIVRWQQYHVEIAIVVGVVTFITQYVILRYRWRRIRQSRLINVRRESC